MEEKHCILCEASELNEDGSLVKSLTLMGEVELMDIIACPNLVEHTKQMGREVDKGFIVNYD